MTNPPTTSYSCPSGLLGGVKGGVGMCLHDLVQEGSDHFDAAKKIDAEIPHFPPV
jgi:hypothetical protein